MEKQVLVLDDEDVVCEVIDEELSKRGYEIRTAHTGEEAIHLMDQADFDLLMVDLKLPTKVSGVVVIQKFKERHPKGKIIVITGYPDPTLEEEVKALGVDRYLFKPADMDPNRISEEVQAVFAEG